MAARNDCYTDEERAEIAAHVLVNVACGRFVSRIFREDETTDNGIRLPAAQTFWRWILEDDQCELEDKLALARTRGIEALLDETLDIADDTVADTITDPDSGTARPNTEWISRSKLRIETRIKLAQMMKPKTYGPKLDLTSNGEAIGAAQMLQEARKRAQHRPSIDGE